MDNHSRNRSWIHINRNPFYLRESRLKRFPGINQARSFKPLHLKLRTTWILVMSSIAPAKMMTMAAEDLARMMVVEAARSNSTTTRSRGGSTYQTFEVSSSKFRNSLAPTKLTSMSNLISSLGSKSSIRNWGKYPKNKIKTDKESSCYTTPFKKIQNRHLPVYFQKS